MLVNIHMSWSVLARVQFDLIYFKIEEKNSFKSKNAYNDLNRHNFLQLNKKMIVNMDAEWIPGMHAISPRNKGL